MYLLTIVKVKTWNQDGPITALTTAKYYISIAARTCQNLLFDQHYSARRKEIKCADTLIGIYKNRTICTDNDSDYWAINLILTSLWNEIFCTGAVLSGINFWSVHKI